MPQGHNWLAPGNAASTECVIIIYTLFNGSTIHKGGHLLLPERLESSFLIPSLHECGWFVSPSLRCDLTTPRKLGHWARNTTAKNGTESFITCLKSL